MKRSQFDSQMSEPNFQRLLGTITIAAGVAVFVMFFGASAKKAIEHMLTDSSSLVYSSDDQFAEPMYRKRDPVTTSPVVEPRERIAERIEFSSTDAPSLPTFRPIPAIPESPNDNVQLGSVKPLNQVRSLQQDKPKELQSSEVDFPADVNEWPELSSPETEELLLPELPPRISAEEEVGRALPQQTKSRNNPIERPAKIQRAIFQSGIQSRLPSPVRVDKQVRKANWAEIEVEPLVNSRVPLRSLQQPMLTRQRTKPQVENRAQEHLRYGESLARRRSFYAAREEFILALLLISSSHSAESKAGDYSDRFAQALTALDEIGDFVSVRNNDTVFQQKVLAHKTQLIEPSDIGKTPPLKALDLYCGFAQSQIEQAVGHSAAGSQALHALGKLESKMSEASGNRRGVGRTKALVFFRAAISVNSGNSVCANDLGVLLFQMGRLQEAESAFKASLGSSQTQLGWSNLASVHNQLANAADNGDEKNRQLWLANLATKESQKFAGATQDNRFAGNQWASTSEFQDNAAFPDMTMQQVPGSPTAEVQSQATSKSASLIQKVKGWY